MFSDLDDLMLSELKSILTRWLDDARKTFDIYRKAKDGVKGVEAVHGYVRRLFAVCAAAEGKKIRVLEYGLKKVTKEIEKRSFL